MAKSKKEKQKIFLKAFKDKAGNVSEACIAANIARSSYYNWYNEDLKSGNEFKEAVDELNERLTDFVESKLMEKIQGVPVEVKSKDGKKVTAYRKEPETTAIIFYLKTKGKKRGYVEKQQVENTNKNFNINLDNIPKTDKAMDIADKLFDEILQGNNNSDSGADES
jgi:hypothetical protein